jgi:hypothetical protein
MGPTAERDISSQWGHAGLVHEHATVGQEGTKYDGRIFTNLTHFLTI